MISLEALKIVALLCSLHSSGTIQQTQELQESCQKYYVNCFYKKDNKGNFTNLEYLNSRYLQECILEKK